MPFKAETMQIISVDDHLLEHPKVWTDRMPARYRDVAPHVISDGHQDYWAFEDRAQAYSVGLSFAAGKKFEDINPNAISFSDLTPGCYDPSERVKDMDTDGVWGSLCFPSYARFAGMQFADCKDKDLGLLCVQAYNDFIIDEWCAAAPERFIPMGIMPMWDANLAAKEIERVASRGMRTIGYPEAVQPLGLPSWHTGYWDPVFEVASQAGLPLSVHQGTSQQRFPVSTDAVGTTASGLSAAGIVLIALPTMAFVSDLIFSHVFQKFPKLQIALSEGGVGWIPYIKERMDYTYVRQGHWSKVELDAMPSHIFDRHFTGCFIDDEAGVANRHRIGMRNLAVETDYPHSDTTWPHTVKRIAEVFRDVPDNETHQIVELNARELYNFPRPS